jgi:transcriptional regulator with XRE-family HTH domain
LLGLLREARELRSVSQRQLSKQLDREFTFIVKVEKGTRRLDVVELIEICIALNVDPAALVDKLAATMTPQTASSQRRD